MGKRLIFWASFSVVALGVVLGALYALLVPGLSSARTEPPLAETVIAAWLLHQSVPDAAKMRANPLGADPADVTAGRDLYRQKCELCHAYDGSGKTNLGAGEYPRPPTLHAAVTAMSDGEIFYHIRNGIRNTGMPAWGLPDREVWQLVTYIRNLPRVAQMTPEAAPALQNKPHSQRRYVGSVACKNCHESVYASWSKTRMANVVRDPRQHPDAIIPDFSKPDPLLTFTTDDIALAYGSRWKQRYFKKVGDDYFVFPAQWDVAHQMWRPYFVANGTDWWATLYPPDNFERPTAPLCDGCHSVNLDIVTKTVTEWNVGCERCHGPGEAHVGRPTRDNILDPARFDYVHASDTCIQCHSHALQHLLIH